jgi:hypothetical protein
MYLKTKFRKRNRNRLAGTKSKSRKYRRRSIKRGGTSYRIECTSDPKTKSICCKQIKV